jgi:uncharacterized protein (TIGR00730 family)
MRRLCVFCGSQTGRLAAYADAASALGRLLAERRIGLVYGGGRVGMMGVLADSVLAHGGEAIGVIPQSLVERELAHTGVTDLRIVTSMHERKALMAELSDAFIALPGGFGTFEEFCEVTTWVQLGLHQKPCGLLNVAGFFDPLLQLFDHATEQGFIHPQHRSIVIVASDPAALIERISQYCPPPQRQWIDVSET